MSMKKNHVTNILAVGKSVEKNGVLSIGTVRLVIEE